eukprot:jgi/Undpi1/7889/HiC_scaffold_24.g10361.m1
MFLLLLLIVELEINSSKWLDAVENVENGELVATQVPTESPPKAVPLSPPSGQKPPPGTGDAANGDAPANGDVVADKGKDKDKAKDTPETKPQVSLVKLFSYADRSDKLFMFIGTLAACIHAW